MRRARIHHRSELHFFWFFSVVVFLMMSLLGTGCASPGKRTAAGAGIGALGGAGVGGVIGGGKGAIIGAGVGAVAGGVIGNRMDKQAAELAEVAETRRTAEGIMVNLKNDLLFDTGKATLKPSAIQQLNSLSQILVKYPTNRIMVSGHTDSVGADSMNNSLSFQRAQAVRSILTQNGVKPEQIQVEGYGESRPVATNDSASGRAQNRRVELQITDTAAAE